MDPVDSTITSNIKISKNDLINKVAEIILNSKEALNVIDPKDDKIVGSLNPSKVIKVLFGS
jgi:hypothetical protein